MVRKKSKKKTKSFKFLYWLIPLILITLLIGFLIIYFNAINHVEIDKTKITKINNFGSSGFDVEAYIELTNPSMVSLKAKRIEYELTLGDTTKKNTLKNFNLPSGETTRIKIKQHVSWGLSLGVAKNMLLGKDTLLELKGKAILMDSPIIIDIPFKEEFDMTNEITDYIARKTKETGKNIIDGVIDLFK